MKRGLHSVGDNGRDRGTAPSAGDRTTLDQTVDGVLRFVNGASDVLLVGRPSDALATAFEAAGSEVTCVLPAGESLDEAKVLCEMVETTEAHATSLPLSLPAGGYDAVVFLETLESFDKPWLVLQSARPLLKEGGAVIALLPHIGHGALRLAVATGTSLESSGAADHYRGFTYENACNLLLRAGFDATHVERIDEPIFSPDGLLGLHEPSEFPAALITRIESGSDATVRYFLFRATSQANGEPTKRSVMPLANEHERLNDRAQNEVEGLRSLLHGWAERTAALERLVSDDASASPGGQVHNEVLELRATAAEAAARETWRLNESLQWEIEAARDAAKLLRSRFDDELMPRIAALEEAAATVSNLESQLDSVTQRHAAAETELRILLEESRASAEDLALNLTAERQAREALESDSEALRNTLDARGEALTTLNQKLEDLHAAIGERDATVARNEERISVNEGAIASLTLQLSSEHEARVAAESETQSLRESAESRAEALASAKSLVEELHNQLDKTRADFEKQSAELSQQLADVEAAMDDRNAAAAQAEAEADALRLRAENSAEALTIAEATMEQLRAQLDTTREDLDAREAQTTQRLAEMQAVVDERNAAADQAATELESLRIGAESRAEALAIAEAALEELRAELDAARSDYEGRVAQSNHKLGELQAVVEERNATVAAAEADADALRISAKLLSARLETVQADLDARVAESNEKLGELQAVVEERNATVAAAEADADALRIRAELLSARLETVQADLDARVAESNEKLGELQAVVEERNAALATAEANAHAFRMNAEQLGAQLETAHADLEVHAAEATQRLEEMQAALDGRNAAIIQVEAERDALRITVGSRAEAVAAAESVAAQLREQLNAALSDSATREAEARRRTDELERTASELNTAVLQAQERTAAVELLLSESRARAKSSRIAQAIAEAQLAELHATYKRQVRELGDEASAAKERISLLDARLSEKTAALAQAERDNRLARETAEERRRELTASREMSENLRQSYDDLQLRHITLDERLQNTEAALNEAGRRVEALSGDVSIARVQEARAQDRMLALERALDEAAADGRALAEAQAIIRDLGEEAKQLHNQHAEQERALVEATEALNQTLARMAELSATSSVSRVRAAAAEEELLRTKAELEEIRKAALAERSVLSEFLADVRENSDRLAADLRTERERMMAELQSTQRQLLETEDRLSEEIRELRARAADAEHALAAQADVLIANMQSESAQMSRLVDTVQSSRFWKFKRWLNRLRGRAFGM